MRTVTLLGVLSMTAFMIFWYNVLISECKGSNFFSNYIKNIQKSFVHDIFKQFIISYSESLSFLKVMPSYVFMILTLCLIIIFYFRLFEASHILVSLSTCILKLMDFVNLLIPSLLQQLFLYCFLEKFPVYS